MSLNSTPSSERVHIGFFGRRNAGKSSVVNRVTGQELSVVSDVKGTTTDPVMKAMELLPMGPVQIIDTPGIKGFGTFDMEEEEIGHYFPEIFKVSAECKYGNCTHRHEPGCAVRKAVEEHLISESRYTSYLNMLEDKEEGKYRAAY